MPLSSVCKNIKPLLQRVLCENTFKKLLWKKISKLGLRRIKYISDELSQALKTVLSKFFHTAILGRLFKIRLSHQMPNLFQPNQQIIFNNFGGNLFIIFQCLKFGASRLKSFQIRFCRICVILMHIYHCPKPNIAAVPWPVIKSVWPFWRLTRLVKCRI